jgi:hypothetical protein
MNTHADTSTKMGTAGGTITALMVNIGADDILRTTLLTIIGATVSFGVSLLLKQLLKWYRQYRHKT